MEPIGGLCNRLRAIESIIPWCINYERELVIIWNVDETLNCSFHELFEPIFVEGLSIKILNIRRKRLLFFKYSILKIPTFHKVIITLKNTVRIRSEYLFEIYNSKSYIEHSKSMKDSDIIFAKNISRLLCRILKSRNTVIWIESCYRLTAESNFYSIFVPKHDLQEKIESVKRNWGHSKCIGIHIRGTDNLISSQYSTIDKFISIIERKIFVDPDIKFFISTDTPLNIENLFNKFPYNIIYYKISSYNRNRKLAIKDAIVDLFCLSGTIMIYGSYFSSFSQVAAEIGGIEEYSVK